CRGRRGSLEGDVHGIKDCEWRSIFSIEDRNQTLDCWTVKSGSVVREVGVEFCNDVTRVTWKKSRFHVQATVRCFHSENFRARNFSLALQTKHFLHRVDTVAQAQQPFDIAATQQERIFSLHPVLRPTWRFRRRG